MGRRRVRWPGSAAATRERDEARRFRKSSHMDRSKGGSGGLAGRRGSGSPYFPAASAATAPNSSAER
ncbi:hypothetical protein Plo01_42150 [Planobispora longispora]|uniref:Uncharacterized protein n=1 Tax=Planobispora longispora TaxID=28887 RepID=A0A8J3RJT3_9ACTN|nr:hypothetical protein GCM10020093_050760 [Planobispora longispora]GIH77786.1 hypothetical protein Plo01_42150 [Planobispora longispora]